MNGVDPQDGLMHKPAAMQSSQATVETLDRAECLALLGTQRLGRIAVLVDPAAGPHVVPVNYALFRGSIVLRSIPGTKLDRLATSPVTFEVDSFDPYVRMGWSVIVEGLACKVTGSELDVEELNLTPLLNRPDSHWVRLTPRSITGRRVTAGP